MFRLILLAPLLILLVLFGLSNREEVALRLWPFDLAWAVPLSVAVLLIAAVFFLFGAFIAWAAALPYRRRAKALENTNRILQGEVAELRAKEAREVGPVPPPANSLARITRPAA
ncbi:LapA family protein [Siccirubricoccus sp. KC 17139]|uniref:LapA family protein n=1 Tax=Siccirubricoccus soli TaxID=2899147 RepID=A0ABT1D6V1_9PROT|nr:LapA family protein [Siccirubricoccus soli]MCO6417653.1 LapA family protein [Siccirubricoccus soli]MCP2683788.1 LapA family protein [Siccirubricoccus soli]